MRIPYATRPGVCRIDSKILGQPDEPNRESDPDCGGQLCYPEGVDAGADNRAQAIVNLEVSTGDDPIDVHAGATGRGLASATAVGRDLLSLRSQDVGKPLISSRAGRDCHDGLFVVVEQ